MATVTDTKSPTNPEISSQKTDATTNQTTPEGLDASTNQTTPEGLDTSTNQTTPEGLDAFTMNQITPEGPNPGFIVTGITVAMIFVSAVLSLGVVLVIVAVWRKKHKKQVITYDEGTDQHGAINRKIETVFTEVNGLSDETAKNKAHGQHKDSQEITLTLSSVEELQDCVYSEITNEQKVSVEMHMDVNIAYGKLDNSKDTEIITTDNEAYGHVEIHMDVNTAYGKLDNSKDTEIITTENEAYGQTHLKRTRN